MNEVPRDLANVVPQSSPMLDHSFTLQAIMEIKGSMSELTAKTDRLISDVKEQADKVDALRHQVTFVRGAMWVIGGGLAAGIALATWYLSSRLNITFSP